MDKCRLWPIVWLKEKPGYLKKIKKEITAKSKKTIASERNSVFKNLVWICTCISFSA
jgi:hypothetical protein